MEITLKQKYIISKNTLSIFRNNKEIYFIINDANAKDSSRFTKIDFSKDTGFLPIDSNKYSERNAEKWFTIDGSKPLEHYSYDIWCTRYKWAGRGRSEAYQEWVSVDKTRKHRDYHNPYEVYFYYEKDKNRFISDGIVLNDDNFPKIRNTINILLKVFGECVVSDEDYAYNGKIEIVNWVLLPSGSWSKTEISRYIGKCKKNVRENLEHNLDILVDLKPNQIIVGENGFKGYFAFKYESQGICILETKHILNATYIFDVNQWEELSKKTKTEIIEFKLVKERVFHRKDWIDKINKYFK